MPIYLIYGLDSEKCYVGKTIRTLAIRWHQHLDAVRQGSKTHLANAIRKYGSQRFEKQILFDDTPDNKTLNNLEKLFIILLRSTDHEYGYNIMSGGDGISPGTKLSKETCKKLSEAHKGKPNKGHFKKGHKIPHPVLSPESRTKISKKISQLIKGNKRRKGIQHDEESRRKMRIAAARSGAPKKAFEAMVAMHPDWKDKARAGRHSFWNNLVGQQREEFLAQRGESIRKAKAAKKANRQPGLFQ